MTDTFGRFVNQKSTDELGLKIGDSQPNYTYILIFLGVTIIAIISIWLVLTNKNTENKEYTREVIREEFKLMKEILKQEIINEIGSTHKKLNVYACNPEIKDVTT